MALTKASLIDLNGQELILDADADTSITADTDDQIDIKVGGSDTVHMGLTTYNASDRLVATNTSGNASITIVGATDGESSIFMADGTSGDASYRGYVQYQHTNDNMNFGTAGAERMRIDSSGSLLIGTTSGLSSARLRVKSIGNAADTYTCEMGSSDGTTQLLIRSDGVFFTGTDTGSPYNVTTGNNANVVITSDGILRRSTSSLRYKKDIADATWGLTEVKQLRPVTFKSNTTGEFADDKTYGGLIAEEVHALGLTEFVDYNDDDEPDALHYGNMVSLLTKAIQEQQTQIEALQAEINTLKGE